MNSPTLTFALGTTVRFSVQFLRDPTAEEIEAGTAASAVDYQPVDPSTVVLRTMNQLGVEGATLQYLVDVEIERTDVGAYRAYLPKATAPGLWRYRWEGTGVGTSATEGSYRVAESPFP